jgi:prepilin-type N-terminal cleavage/methylation domain-containing protein
MCSYIPEDAMTSVTPARRPVRGAAAPSFLPRPRRAAAARSPRGGFSLVELLVVIGVIALLMGLMMPALQRSRAAANATKCMNNLRQIGTFYYIYANANQDRIPLGTTAVRKGGGDVHPEDHSVGLPGGTSYHTAFNHYVYYGGRPTAAGGPIVASGLIRRANASILYCPDEVHGQKFEFDTWANRWPDDEAGNPVGSPMTRMSYAVRPLNRVWGYDVDRDYAHYPGMPKLVKLKSYALLAELPQVPPSNHGTDASPFFHVLYADGSVRAVAPKAYAASYAQYVEKAPPYDPGVRQASNDHCFSEDRHAETIWWVLDRQ